MGKVKKWKSVKKEFLIPLHQQIEESDIAQPTNRTKERNRTCDDAEYVDSKLTKKILHQARKQQQELEDEEGLGSTSTKKTINLTGMNDEDDDDDEEEIPDDNDISYLGNPTVSEADEKALELFMNKNPARQLTLADLIMDKLTEKQTELKSQFSDNESLHLTDINPRVRELYEGVRDVLSKYRSGKLPKAFKIIPKLRNWEQILYITEPSRWSAASMYAATRIFTANLKDKMAQRFFNLILLPRIRDDIADYKRLNFHLYQALKKSLYKSAAFNKGIILPLCESGTCTLREAIIIGSIVAKNSIPMLHSAATLLKLAEMDYSGANSIFIRILLDKKYALPYRVVDGVVFHFLRFERDKRELPVLWHQALFTFVQRYKGDISSEQREALLNLLRSKSHPTITPEIRRELKNAKCRDVEMKEPPPNIVN